MRFRIAQLLCLSLLLAACSSVRVRPSNPHDDRQRRSMDILDGRLSAATRESLRARDIQEDSCSSEPQPCLRKLATGSGLDDERRLSASAELWLRVALAHDRSKGDPSTSAIDAYLEAARASYAYLFYTARTPGERAFDDRQLQVRDFFNQATERVAVLFMARKTSSWRLRWGSSEIGLPRELIAASRLRFSGLRNTYRRDGIGAAFVTVAAESEAGYQAAAVVLRFPGGSLAEVLAAREATLEAYDSVRHGSLALHGREARLAASFTAPYALWLERSRFGREAKQALLGGSDRLAQPRVYLMQPYDPDRRTIVLIHGLASSPEAWVDLANELMGDDEIRKHYQVWQVFYRSSAPIAYNLHAIRQALDETLARLDPDRTAAASRGMVLVGHSMGGVIARLLVVDAGDRLWTSLLGHPPQGSDRQRLAVLAPYLDLTPMPEVSRAVFLASPHRGAPKASGPLGKIAARLVHLPAALVGTMKEAAGALVDDQPAAAAQLSRAPDGIDGLSDRFPFRQVTSELPIAPWVTYHSIIGCTRPAASVLTCSDGLVPYSSAHLEGAASELTVTSGHSVQKTPEAIVELRRILHLLDSSPLR